jgi:glycosyltransferase involved in cell wall biosynthesis
MSTVSVCLLTYNRAQWLPQTLQSVLAQTFQHYELIINDNGSTDNTEEVCRKFEANDGRVRYFRNETNLGVVGNYQTALERTSGEYVAFLHDNDQFHPDLLAKWVEALDKYPSAGFVFNSIEFVDFNDNHLRSWLFSYPPLIHPGTIWLDEMLTRWGSPVFGMVMVVRKCLDTVGPFDWKRFPHVGDIDMWMRLAACFDVAYISQPLIRARIREKNHFADNWAIYDEFYRIQLLNIKRRYGSNEQLQRRVLRKLHRTRHYYGCRLLLGWMRRGQFKTIREAIPFLLNEQENIMRIVGRCLDRVCKFIGPSRHTHSSL